MNIKGSKKSSSEKAEKKKMKEVTNSLNDISEALSKLAGNPSKPDNVNYNYGHVALIIGGESKRVL